MATSLPLQTETAHDGAHIISESNGALSRLTGIIKQDAGSIIEAGEYMELDTGKWKRILNSVDYSAYAEGTLGVMYARVDATAGDIAAKVLHIRDCEVNQNEVSHFSAAWAGGAATEANFQIGLATARIIERVNPTLTPIIG